MPSAKVSAYSARVSTNKPEKDPREVFRAYLATHGLKASRQRDHVAEAFFGAQGHLRVDELMARVREVDPQVSQATVYRTLKLLVDCGLAEGRNFMDGQTRYELAELDGGHHDHLICTGCGTILEFVDERIEALQDKVAAAHGFLVAHHKMELYGLCAKCSADESSKPGCS